MIRRTDAICNRRAPNHDKNRKYREGRPYREPGRDITRLYSTRIWL